MNNRIDSTIKPLKGTDKVLYDNAKECDSIKGIEASNLNGDLLKTIEYYLTFPQRDTLVSHLKIQDSLSELNPNYEYANNNKTRAVWIKKNIKDEFNLYLKKGGTVSEKDSIWQYDALYYVDLKNIKAIIVKETFIGKAQK